MGPHPDMILGNPRGAPSGQHLGPDHRAAAGLNTRKWNSVALPPMYASSTRKHPVTTLLMHATAGASLEGALETLRLKGLSYHYVIPKKGPWVKLVAAAREAYHAGVSLGPDGPSVNHYSVGISFVNLNDGIDPYTPSQIDQAVALGKALKQQFPDSLRWVTSHAIVSPGRKTDPKGFDLDEYAAKIGLQVWRP